MVTDPEEEEEVVTDPNEVFSDLEMDRFFLDLKSFLGRSVMSFMVMNLESKKDREMENGEEGERKERRLNGRRK